MVEIDRQLSEKPHMDSQKRKTLARHHTQLRRDIIRLAGLSCCGGNMRLDRFLSCLSPTMSRDLWLAIRWIHDAPNVQRSCAWPDCGAYLPASCIYRLPNASARRWHCVTCLANSMDCARRVEGPQTGFPFLPSGQRALTPAR
jgi:hypothetical protein